MYSTYGTNGLPSISCARLQEEFPDLCLFKESRDGKIMYQHLEHSKAHTDLAGQRCMLLTTCSTQMAHWSLTSLSLAKQHVEMILEAVAHAQCLENIAK